MHGGFGFGDRNSGGVASLDFTVACDLTTVNSLFKEEDHLVTFRSDITKTQIDYFCIRSSDKRMCKDCKVISSELLGTQHRLLVMDLVRKSFRVKKRSVGDVRTRWWAFTRCSAKFLEKIKTKATWKLIEDGDATWEGMA